MSELGPLLIKATKKGDILQIQYLLHHGADINYKQHKQVTPSPAIRMPSWAPEMEKKSPQDSNDQDNDQMVTSPPELEKMISQGSNDCMDDDSQLPPPPPEIEKMTSNESNDSCDNEMLPPPPPEIEKMRSEESDSLPSPPPPPEMEKMQFQNNDKLQFPAPEIQKMKSQDSSDYWDDDWDDDDGSSVTITQGECAVHVAARSGALEVLQLLLDHGAKDLMYGEDNNQGINTIQHVKLEEISSKFATIPRSKGDQRKALNLDCKANDRSSKIKSVCGDYIIHVAARYNQSLIVREIVSRAKEAQGACTAQAELDKRNGENATALSLAVRHSNYDVLSELLQLGADPNIIVEDPATTALHIAVDKEDFQAINMLLDNKAEVNIDAGESALHVAVRNDSVDTAQILLEAGADVFWRKGDRITPYELAKSEAMKKLLYQYNNQQKCKDGEMTSQDVTDDKGDSSASSPSRNHGSGDSSPHGSCAIIPHDSPTSFLSRRLSSSRLSSNSFNSIDRKRHSFRGSMNSLTNTPRRTNIPIDSKYTLFNKLDAMSRAQSADNIDSSHMTVRIPRRLSLDTIESPPIQDTTDNPFDASMGKENAANNLDRPLSTASSNTDMDQNFTVQPHRHSSDLSGMSASKTNESIADKKNDCSLA